jgi:hypothetical protein
MSLTALPVTVSDLTTLQAGLTFTTNTDQATTQAAKINAPGQTTDSVFTYAASLLQTNISLSQVAMGVSALMEGGTVAVGSTTTANTLTLFATQFLPDQVRVALANNFNPTVFAAESLGSALSTQASFQSFVGQSVAQFSQAVGAATGVGVPQIQTFVTNWQNFFTANPVALQGRTVTQASYGAAFGDAVGVALLNPTSANLQTQTTNNVFTGLVANALIDIAEGKYEVGKALNALAIHTPLQGEGGGVTPPPAGQTLTFTPGTDNFDSKSAGDTLYQGNIAGKGEAPATLSPLQFDSAKDSGGTDTIQLNVAAATATLASVASLVTGVETWSINETNGKLDDATGIIVSSLQGATFIEQISNTAANFADFTKVGTGQTVGFTSTTPTNVTKTITVDTGVNTATVKLSGLADVNLTFADTTAANLTKIDISGKAGDAAPHTLTVNATAVGVTTDVFAITSTGNTKIVLNGTAAALAALKTVDASTSSGPLTLDVSGANFKNVSTVKLGSGADSLTDQLSVKTTATVTDDVGAGNDVVALGLDTPTTKVALSVALGAGLDTVTVTTGKFSNIFEAPNAANTDQQLVTFSDFKVADNDKLIITGGGVNFTQVTAGTQNTIDGKGNVFEATQAAAAAGVAVNAGVWFQFKGAAYIFENNVGANTFDAKDGLIQLVGVTSADLANAAVFQHT